MRNPFTSEADHARVQKILDGLTAVRKDIEEFRDWLKDHYEVKGEEDCDCVYREAFELETLLFALYRSLHLFGSGIITHVRTIVGHDGEDKSAAVTLEVSDELAERLAKEGITSDTLLEALREASERAAAGEDDAVRVDPAKVH